MPAGYELTGTGRALASCRRGFSLPHNRFSASSNWVGLRAELVPNGLYVGRVLVVAVAALRRVAVDEVGGEDHEAASCQFSSVAARNEFQNSPLKNGSPPSPCRRASCCNAWRFRGLSGARLVGIQGVAPL